jgi:hypothetical protein
MTFWILLVYYNKDNFKHVEFEERENGKWHGMTFVA